MEAYICQERWRPFAPTWTWLCQTPWVKGLEGFCPKMPKGPIAACGMKSEGKALTSNPPFLWGSVEVPTAESISTNYNWEHHQLFCRMFAYKCLWCDVVWCLLGARLYLWHILSKSKQTISSSGRSFHQGENDVTFCCALLSIQKWLWVCPLHRFTGDKRHCSEPLKSLSNSAVRSKVNS